MKKLLLSSLLCAAALMPLSAAQRTFTTACFNVDGLPFFNSDGPKEEGTKAISQLISQKGWDFFGVSEDFGFHDQLVENLTDYNVGTYRGTVTTANSSAEKMADTDGLCFFWKNGVEVTGEKWVGWTKKFGSLTKGADECIDKGYRYYCVNLGDGFEIDVYVLHMNSGDEAGHLEARAIQLQQLADAIVDSDNKRPIIIMGDTNCRWTRDGLKSILFNTVNADPRFTMNDPWVDYMWNGWQPTPGGSIVVSDYGNQKGEVVDKIFYINNTDAKGIHLSANGYLHDDSFIKEDGKPLADHFPIVIEFTIEDNYVQPEPGTDDNMGLTGEYYLLNEGTGNYLAIGGAWGTHAMAEKIGNRINLFKGDEENTYGMRSTAGFINDPASNTGADIYMDAPKPRYWSFTEVGENSYTITYTNNENKKMALAAVEGDAMASAQGVEFVADDTKQIWKLVTEQELIDALSNATAQAPMDATFLIRGYNIGVNDSDNSAWKLTFTNASYAKQDCWGPNDWNTKTWVYRVYNSLKSSKPENAVWAVQQVVKNLPNGKYSVKCQILTDNIADADGFIYSLNGQRVDGVKALEGGNGKVTTEKAVELFATPDYDVTADVTVNDNTLDIKMERAAHSEISTVCFDNFILTYYGTEDGSGIDSIEADSNAPAVYYNLQGIKVENPENGLYIVKRGTKITKEIIRK